MGQRTRYDPGTFCWVGLATSDVAAARAFYASLFGWEAKDLQAQGAGAYTMLRSRAEDVAILYRQQPEARAAGAPPHWTSYISVEDADATAARADELGGAAVFRAPFDVLDAGRVAAIRDPTRAIASLWQPRSRIGATLVNDPGALCWNELTTTEVELAKRFRRRRGGPRDAAGRATADADDRRPYRALDGHRRSSGCRVRGLRRRDRPMSDGSRDFLR
jgi:uncharacterized protein